MPAGDLLNADYQIEVNGYLHGNGCTVAFDGKRGGLQGLYGGAVKALYDYELAHDDGDIAGVDLKASKLITAALLFPSDTDGDAADVLTLAEALEVVWDAGTDTELHFQFPGVGHGWVEGRTRGIVIDYDLVPRGIGFGLATFYVPNPVIFYDDGTSV